ncbi:putative transcriptional regulator [Dinoroseobacter shibae DFL 12 = DSM 16493]|uniref:Putative transcriptional regulator n=1 Tax=Dinoroseobacter shibae (strain DSM 16493 / NCIMB 14021 / DFL 12) TaxID=398580 RepID=A8LI00_DINSH|nr:AraC family transcriptional regulator [Dinoroseobacter shibae]ABV94334.1 putative transcriptional regulator [Dinoroseobacter shibae DFL 12 = DSM 16493]URF48579.1 AraC family transcriptional regulator [Dinoroseobacter shibae]URF50071.1 AraC family transcriptional regulator [Dinoroseobacter shibae]
MPPESTPQLSTVSSQFIADWLQALRPLCSVDHFRSLLKRAALQDDCDAPTGRVTLDQVVCLYQLAAVETEDEMMGLWSRPIRQRALQHLLTSIREATTLSSALYRFSTFWNLLLDDYQFSFAEADNVSVLKLVPQTDQAAQRFGHMLILKLAHGLISWLARYEVPVKAVGFAFEAPAFEEDYAVIFPAPVRFAQSATSIAFGPGVLGPVQVRSSADLTLFLENAPRDWIFTQSQVHTQSLRVRTYLSQTGWDSANLTEAAAAMHVTPRTLIRKLEADGTSFQAIKDALRRDIAIRHLQTGQHSVEAIAHEVGFSSAANFHKAFQRWTGNTPSSYRRKPYSGV